MTACRVAHSPSIKLMRQSDNVRDRAKDCNSVILVKGVIIMGSMIMMYLLKLHLVTRMIA